MTGRGRPARASLRSKARRFAASTVLSVVLREYLSAICVCVVGSKLRHGRFQAASIHFNMHRRAQAINTTNDNNDTSTTTNHE